MSINFFSEDIAFELENKHTIIRWINQVIEDHKSSLGTINYIFCNDEYLLRLNKQYLDHDTYTDIITFDYSTPKVLSGEIYISIDRVEENSIKFKSTFLNELHRVIIHGILHLTGQGDKTEKESKIMRSKEDHYLNLIDSK
jgi:rRNA maturation RNase YbeY